MSLMNVTMRSFAKINLGLRIGPARDDGFHGLLTVYQTIGLHDVIRVSVGRGRGIEIQCRDLRVPRDESNTCFRIAEKVLASFKERNTRVLIQIEKRLPVQGGLGGASANAVTALLGLERALGKRLAAEERLRIAAEVGSDLPLFLVGGTVLGVGRGEQVYPLPDLPAIPCVVVTPEVGVSTPKAFAEWDRIQGLKPLSALTTNAALKGRSSTNPPELTEASSSDRMNKLGRGLSAWLSEMCSSAPSELLRKRGRAENLLLWLVRAGIENDFERVIFPEYPELSSAKSTLLRAGAKYASLSGSGSALYGLFASREAAKLAAAKLGKSGLAAQATTTLPRVAYWKRIVG